MTAADIVDLSHPVRHGMVTYPGLPGPEVTTQMSREESRTRYADGVEFHIGRISMVANTGTYLDAPFHRYSDGADTSGVALDRVVDVEGVVVRTKETGEVGPEAIDRAAVAGKAVLFHTGWDAHWGTGRYFSDTHPFLGRAAAELLVELEPAVVGIDSVNIDSMTDRSRPAHSLLLEQGIPIVEHLHHLDKLPTSGFRFFAPPLAVVGLGTCSVRAFGVVDRDGAPHATPKTR
ncbi:cyclase family protein (plasmid) [Streptomyces sp. BB1-1-1]|uniref:cyclase family protein n=1 Tax=Streptomyces sp. BB1-1-1 TaxID=3074430 RepID=UPI002877620E|nr:cyclase family protein [Streptomyces sp. BB1-1-1]WND32865.1 cyclase family protein [Streptomyces sp. BB1-1-1]WND40066.1 cyclase family protein [Streptomyces sp. BB1-1-1]WND40901.1 cyclase family protein [Streptomyces sp. BB1-1-1]